MKQQRTERVYIDGTPLTQLIEQLQDAVKKYGGDAFLSNEIECEYGSDYIGTTIVYETEETEAERVKREAREKATAERDLAYKRQQYEALKKEFE